MASKGYRVFGTVRRAEDGQALEEAGATPLMVDVLDGESISAASQYVAQQLNGAPLVGLINNAGIVVPGPVEVLELDDFRRTFEVNLFGVVAVTKAFLPALKASHG
ncbi:MAG: SDR family NAD(P)-dependent oxidoreductase, partial [Planctomycetota bacterium]